MSANFLQKRKRIAALSIVLLLEDEKEKHTKRKRKIYMRDWIARRLERGVYHQLVRELEVEDRNAYQNFFRLSKEQFWFVVEKVRPLIQKRSQPFPICLVRHNIEVDERVAVALRFLATGESFHSLEFSFRISRQEISKIVDETSKAIFESLASEYFKTPSTEREWEEIARKCDRRWDFPNGIGAIDGKRILIKQPANSGSHFFDYKGNNSIVLLAVFGPDYQCIWASVGSNGRSSDSGIWQRSDLKTALSSSDNPLSLPRPRPLPNRNKPVPFVLTGDDAFALTRYMMKPFSQSGLNNDQRVFNYRLSRMRRISENCFGIMANRWRVFRSPIELPPGTIINLVLSALSLHNYLRVDDTIDTEDADGNIIPAPWQNDTDRELASWLDFHPNCSNNYSTEARLIRQEYMEYFNGEGAVPWQWKQCGL